MQRKRLVEGSWSLRILPAKMLILTANKPQYMCVPLKWDTATRPPISMWSVLPWPMEFPLCPLAIVSPPVPAPGLATSIPLCVPCSYLHSAFKPPCAPPNMMNPPPHFIPYSGLTFFPPAFACFPSVSSLLIGPEAKTFVLCLPGLRQATMIAISSYRWSSLRKRRGMMSTDFFRCLVGQGMLLLLLERVGETIFWISSWPTFLLA